MNYPLIKDNVFNKTFLLELQEHILRNRNDFLWKYAPIITTRHETIDDIIKNHTPYYFIHSWNSQNKETYAPGEEYFYNAFVSKIQENTGLSLVTRAKINLYTRQEQNNIHTFHRDLETSGQHVALFFLFDTNGPFYYKVGYNTYLIECKENRMVFFNSDLVHASSDCTDKKCRITINFNYIR